MPGEHCARCGTVRTPGGCACAAVPYGQPGHPMHPVHPVHPDMDETAVLPHTEGPPLVRPYVPAAAEYQEPHPDAFPTALLPPVPAQDAEATALLPPVPPQPYPSAPAPAPAQQPYRPHQQQFQPPYRQQHQPVPPYQPQPQPAELGTFAFQQGDGPGGRAERRVQQHEAPLRRKAAMAAAGVGIVAIGAGIAFALAPAQGKGGNDQAVPAPIGTMTALPTGAAVSAPPSSAAPDSPSPSPTRSSARPSPTVSRAPVIAVKPTTAKPSPPPSPTAAPSTAAPSPTRSTAPTLTPGMRGPDVTAMQRQLRDCGDPYLRVSGKYDGQTEAAVSDYQQYADVQGDPDGVYGPNTRAALEAGTGC
ncbi:peptidoglycan-binding protein [Kitasatospora sp. NPDC056138]|uniref:peptidoglycan-binding domain-containing protein n=1 Tax=Kitasatospora sp. NPDC056138 TaxID=3345724 RepID=UPI0035DB07CE